MLFLINEVKWLVLYKASNFEKDSQTNKLDKRNLPVFFIFFASVKHIHSMCINESLSMETHAQQIISHSSFLTEFVLCGSQNFCLSCIIRVCLFLFRSCYRPAVSLPWQPFGRATQVQEGVGQRHEMHRSVCRNQPRECCILLKCAHHLDSQRQLL